MPSPQASSTEPAPMRKHTRFELCDAHASWQADGRTRLAEMFCEGGPGHGRSCTPHPCRIWPGSDLFAPTATDDVAADWVRCWAVNQ